MVPECFGLEGKGMSLRDVLSHIEPDPEAEQLRKRRLEQVQLVRSRLQVAPNSVTDGEILRCIDCLFHDLYSTTPFEEDYDQFIEALSFTRGPLGNWEDSALKRAWTNFLEDNGSDLDWHLHQGFVQWFRSNEMPLHEIAVLEHARAEYCLGRLAPDEGFLESWLFSLFQLCVRQNFIPRARYVAELIGDYHEDGFVSYGVYDEILDQQSALRYRELGQAIEEDRVEVERRLCSEYGPLFQNLHEVTRSLAIDAELWSKANLRAIEPAAGPRRWALATEAEFHEKVFQPNRHVLESALSGGNPYRRLGRGRSCSVGQIAHLIERSHEGGMGSAAILGVFDRTRGGPHFARGGRLDLPQILLDHRDKIAHVTERGSYIPADCNEFLRVVCESGWAFRFLEAIQPR
jgi:hypothetical protein